jgi:hypothetical protein
VAFRVDDHVPWIRTTPGLFRGENMSLNKIKSGIQNRAAKIKSMQFAFDSDAKIKLYSDTSLKILKEDYISEVRAMQEADKSRLQEIKESYLKKQPSLTEKHQRLAMTKNEHQAMSLKQLKTAAAEALGFIPYLQDVNELRSLASELRVRGDGDGADALAGFIEAERVAEPWTHNEQYRALQARAKKLDVYASQAESGSMLVLSDDVDHIGQSDIVMIEKIDAGLPEVS